MAAPASPPPTSPPPPAYTVGEYRFLVGFEGDWRDTWWAQDFLDLIARRHRLDEVRAAVDVGCGVGHWGRALLPRLHPEATLIGVDREHAFAEQAAAQAEARGIAGRASYRQGLAEALPVPDASADLVTCQTVLMHVADAARVIAEMRRVLRPGGLLLAVEPNNLAEKAMGLTSSPGLTRAEKLTLLELELICQEGKKALGRGDSTVGELLPRLFKEAGLTDIRVCQSDNCAALIPPYERPEQRIELAQMLEWIDGGIWFGSGGMREQTLELYLAGGGDEAAFASRWAVAMKEVQAWKQAALAGELAASRGGTFYIVSGRTPA